MPSWPAKRPTPARKPDRDRYFARGRGRGRARARGPSARGPSGARPLGPKLRARESHRRRGSEETEGVRENLIRPGPARRANDTNVEKRLERGGAGQHWWRSRGRPGRDGALTNRCPERRSRPKPIKPCDRTERHSAGSRTNARASSSSKLVNSHESNRRQLQPSSSGRPAMNSPATRLGALASQASTMTSSNSSQAITSNRTSTAA
jgi:hypothetical protein